MADVSRFTVRRYGGPRVPERWSRPEQQQITRDTGETPQRPGVPGAVVHDAAGRALVAISDASAVRPDPAGRGLLSRAEALRPAPVGEAWPSAGGIEHDGISWTWWHWHDLDGVLVAEGKGVIGRHSGSGCFAGSTMTSGARTWTLDDVIRPESEAEQRRRSRRWLFRGLVLLGDRVSGHRFLADDGSEAGRLTWVGPEQPRHDESPYEWDFVWSDVVDDGVLVGAAATALRYIAYAGDMRTM